MSDLERAKLIPVSGNEDTPDLNSAIDVQFNPVTLKVNLSNTLKPNTGQGNSRATQFVDKSSSTLTVELVFDTTYIEAAASGAGSAQGSGSNSGGQNGSNRIEQGSDVRQQTKKIAEKFLKPVESGSQMQAPSRVLFQWGTFEFVGIVQSYDETLDFFSPQGRPLRATVALKLAEDRYQFRSNDQATQAAQQAPALSFTGSGSGNGSGAGDSQSVSPVPGGSSGAGNWRDNAMFNGIETPRLPSVAALALPSVSLSAGAGFGISGGVSVGLNAGVNVSVGAGVNAGVNISVSTGANAGATGSAGTAAGGKSSAGDSAPGSASTTVNAAANTPAPPFRFGNSTALGTGVPGAFSPNPKSGLQAGSLQQGSQRLRVDTTPVARGSQNTATSGTAPLTSNPRQTSTTARPQRNVSVQSLLTPTPDSGVGFD